jgi:hypothetical protein
MIVYGWSEDTQDFFGNVTRVFAVALYKDGPKPTLKSQVYRSTNYGKMMKLATDMSADRDADLVIAFHMEN